MTFFLQTNGTDNMTKKSASLTGNQQFIHGRLHNQPFNRLFIVKNKTDKNKALKEIIDWMYLTCKCVSVHPGSQFSSLAFGSPENYLRAYFLSSRKRDKACARGAVRTSSHYVYRSHQM